jgi:uncharacterized membrane protein YphA (DoxX/SURF4 family)
LNVEGPADILSVQEGRAADAARRARREGECVMSILALTLRFALAIVLAVAALAKARSFGDFSRTVEVLIPGRRGVTAVAGGVVAAEAALAVLLAAGVVPSAVAVATLVLFAVFAGISLWAVRRGLHVNCNCFGRSERELGKDSLQTSLVLAAATLVYLALLQIDEPPLSLGELPLAICLGAAAVLAARWAFASRGLVAIVRQRRALDRELAQTARGVAR